MTERPSFETVFFRIAEALSERSTCDRRHVGAVIAAQDGTLVGGGYNGAPSGMLHCTDVGCLVEGDHCTRVLHADNNALWYSDKSRLSGGTMYLYGATPCYRCAQEIIRAGLAWVRCRSDGVYDEKGWRYLELGGVGVVLETVKIEGVEDAV